MSVKWIEAVVPHDGRLKDVAAPSVQHEESLVHLHGLVCTWGGRSKKQKNKGKKEESENNDLKCLNYLL